MSTGRPWSRLAAAAVAALGASAASAAITTLQIGSVKPFADGAAFGSAGAYERVIGVARGELDPAEPRNRGIVNLDKAPRNAAGRVEYALDFELLRPVGGGNRALLYDVTNRGRKFLLPWLMNGAAPTANDPSSAADAGNALFLRHGYTIAWTGWDGDAPKANHGMAIQVPVARNGDAPIRRTIREEFVSGTRGPVVREFKLAYEAASLSKGDAKLTVRRKEADRPVELPAEQWELADARTLRILTPGNAGAGPAVGSLYELHYLARDPKVLGIGFAATRDFVAFLRHAERDTAGTPNPAGAGLKRALAVGISQSGRYLRDHIGQGYNQDESGRKVFDGALAHISGVGRVFLNDEFAQAGRTNTQHEDHTFPENVFPFSTATVADPLTGRSGSLLRGDGYDPLLIEVNTSTEYWQKGASLLHTDPLGSRDLALPAGARVYLVAGTQHAGRPGLTSARGPCWNDRNPHDPSPALRALVVALDRWVAEGVAPPPSRVPTLAERTLVPPDNAGFPALPDFVVARQANELVLAGPDWVHPKPDPSKRYRTLVPATDADGNERAGIVLPDIAAPLATHTGWNLYKAPFPDGELCDRDGSYAPFAATRAERQAKNDPRRSLEERYASHDDYVEQVRRAAAALVADRLLLPEDAAAYVEQARSEAVRKRFAR